MDRVPSPWTLDITETITAHQDFPIVLLSVFLGGLLTLFTNYFLMRRRFRAEKERLRRAFKTEIQQLNISELKIVIEELDSSEESMSVIDEFVDQLNEVSEAVDQSMEDDELPLIDPIEVKQKALVEVGEKMTNINLSSEIYQSNTDKLGKLSSSEIDLIIRFYKLLEITKTDLQEIIQTAQDSLNEEEGSESLASYESQIRQLSSSITDLEELEEEVINELEKGRIRRLVDPIFHHSIINKINNIIDFSENLEDTNTPDMTREEWIDNVEEKLERLLDIDTSDEIQSRDHEYLQNNFQGIPPKLMELALNQDVSVDPNIRESLIDVSKKHADVAAICTREDLQDNWPDDEDEDAERIKIETIREEVLEPSTRTALRTVQSMQDD